MTIVSSPGGQAVLFDLFGVLARHQHPHALPAMARLSGIALDAFTESYWWHRPDYDAGRISVDTYWSRVVEGGGVSAPQRLIDDLRAADIHSWSRMDERMVDYATRLARSGRAVGILSNIPEDLAMSIEQDADWLREMSHVSFSCRLGVAKPDPAAFRNALDAWRVEAARVLFVDDREDNVHVARAEGLAAHHLTTFETLTPVIEEWFRG